MYKQNLRYKKIKDFLQDLNDREVNYIYKKLKNTIYKNNLDDTKITITINGKVQDL